ncbi:MAG: hypothetical protein AAFX05_07425 [Planctomycetota bacterium]
MKAVVALPVLGVVVVAAPALGAATATLSEASWLANATGPISIEDFNDEAEASLPAGATPFDGFSVNPLTADSTFVSPGTGGNNIDGTLHLDPFVAPEDTLFGFPEEAVSLVFDQPANDVAFDFADLFSSSFTGGVDILIDGALVANTVSLGIGANGGAVPATFIGINSDTPFTTLTLASPVGVFGETFGMDNVRFTIPGPATSMLAATAACALVRRRRGV